MVRSPLASLSWGNPDPAAKVTAVWPEDISKVRGRGLQKGGGTQGCVSGIQTCLAQDLLFLLIPSPQAFSQSHQHLGNRNPNG